MKQKIKINLGAISKLQALERWYGTSFILRIYSYLALNLQNFVDRRPNARDLYTPGLGFVKVAVFVSYAFSSEKPHRNFISFDINQMSRAFLLFTILWE